MDNHSNSTQKALRGAAAAANIARGAATGGIYGAAAGAAKSFLPEIALLLCMTILIPMLVFTALPNIVFGYDSARDQDIVDFTGSAHALDRLYQDLAQKDQTVIDRLIEAVLPDFWREGTAQYDSWSVTQDLGHTNRYWLIAIGSVRYRQDLYAMDGAALEALLYDKLTYSATLVERVLHISVQDLSPQAYMDALGFTQEEKDWAALLYSVLAEEQYTGVEDSDGTGYWNTDYGDVLFSDMDTPVVYYNQTDARWGNLPYGKTGTIAMEGCGPAALAIAVSTLTGQTVTPLDVANWSAANGYRCEGNGSYHTLIPAGGAHYGLQVAGIGNDSKRLVEALQEGKLVIALMSKGHFTRGGHFIVLRGVTAEGNILVADPASIKRSGQSWALGIITNEARRGAGAEGPFWVLSR